jgi:hypothetical protein
MEFRYLKTAYKRFFVTWHEEVACSDKNKINFEKSSRFGGCQK